MHASLPRKRDWDQPLAAPLLVPFAPIEYVLRMKDRVSIQILRGEIAGAKHTIKDVTSCYTIISM